MMVVVAPVVHQIAAVVVGGKRRQRQNWLIYGKCIYDTCAKKKKEQVEKDEIFLTVASLVAMLELSVQTGEDPNVEEVLNETKKKREERAQEKPKKYIGVYRHRKKFRAQITIDGTQHKLGVYDDSEEAAREYDRVAIKARKPISKLNFPKQIPNDYEPKKKVSKKRKRKSAKLKEKEKRKGKKLKVTSKVSAATASGGGGEQTEVGQ